MTDKHMPCPYHKKCGGCQLQNLDYSGQLALKQSRMTALLGAYGHVEGIIGMERPEHYRNKVHAAFGLDSRRRPVCGIYQSGSHVIVPVESCMIDDEISDVIIADIRDMLPEFKIQVYDERTGSGWLRHVLVRRGFASGQVMVVLVVASPIFKLQKPFLKKLTELHPEISTVVLNINDRFGPVVLGTREKTLLGAGYIEDELCEKRFRISARSFYQVNPVQAEVLYNTALNMIRPCGSETLLDAYCGVGTIGLIASDRVKQVIGVELNRDAVGDAIENAKLNGVKSCWFTSGDAGKYMEQMAIDGMKPDIVIMDPPRSGADARFVSSLIKIEPERLIYISCGPESLKRDLELLKRAYRVERIQPVDMFPYTNHVETVVMMSKM